MRKKFDKISLIILSIIPNKFIRHYLYPFLFRRKKEYNPEVFFDSWYNAAPGNEFSDGITISHQYNRLVSNYHYNAIENSILLFLIKSTIPQHTLVLDIGSGAGHWIDFYKKALNPYQIDAFDISAACCTKLSQRFKDYNNIAIYKADISENELPIDKEYDVVNAIGVMFHIVDDKKWELALSNVARLLKKGGYFIVGGQFGWFTRVVQFHNTDSYNESGALETFTTFSSIFNKSKEPVLFNKKIRSLRKWIKTSQKYDLHLVKKIKTREDKFLITPENNIIVLEKR
jgi:SAM-dependent methyltransferase